MRRRKSFLLTVIPAEGAHLDLCGQVKSIATGESANFNTIEELKALLIQAANGADEPESLPGSSLDRNLHLEV